MQTILGSGYTVINDGASGANVVAAQYVSQGNHLGSTRSLRQAVRIGVFTLSSSFNGSQLTLIWPAGGLLLEAPTLNGPWTTNTTGANSCNISPTNGTKFFKVLVPWGISKI